MSIGKVISDFMELLCDFAMQLKEVEKTLTSLKVKNQIKKTDSVILERNDTYVYSRCDVTHTLKNITFQVGIQLERIDNPKQDLFFLLITQIYT